MSETWISWAIKAPAPRPGYEGYPGKVTRNCGEILFVVNHSAEGWEAYLKQGHRPGESASWTFSNCQNGTMYQHFPLEAITYTSGGRWQNIQGLGVEHEGVKGQPLNAKQVENDLRLWDDLKLLCPNLRPQVLGQGYREHHELAPGTTTCPNGRIQPLYDAVAAGGRGDSDMIHLIRPASNPGVIYVYDWSTGTKYPLTQVGLELLDGAIGGAGKLDRKDSTIPDAKFNAIPNQQHGVAVGGSVDANALATATANEIAKRMQA